MSFDAFTTCSSLFLAQFVIHFFVILKYWHHLYLKQSKLVVEEWCAKELVTETLCAFHINVSFHCRKMFLIWYFTSQNRSFQTANPRFMTSLTLQDIEMGASFHQKRGVGHWDALYLLFTRTEKENRILETATAPVLSSKKLSSILEYFSSPNYGFFFCFC